MVTARRQIGREDGDSSPGRNGTRRPGAGGVFRAQDSGSGPPSVETCTERMRWELSRVIEGEIIPRLMLAHRGHDPLPCEEDQGQEASPEIDAGTVQSFARTVMEQDSAQAVAIVSDLRRKGVSLETVLVHLLAPAARCLGAYWDEDDADFTQVTVGLCRLQHVLRALGEEMDTVSPGSSGRRVLLAPVPGEQHTFGLMMVAELFRREGWDVNCDPAASVRDLNRLVRQERFDVVAFSLSCDVLLDRLRATIRGVRRASCNTELGILVGGRVFVDHPEMAAQTGADATAPDAREAVRMAERMVSFRAGAPVGRPG